MDVGSKLFLIYKPIKKTSFLQHNFVIATKSRLFWKQVVNWECASVSGKENHPEIKKALIKLKPFLFLNWFLTSKLIYCLKSNSQSQIVLPNSLAHSNSRF